MVAIQRLCLSEVGKWFLENVMSENSKKMVSIECLCLSAVAKCVFFYNVPV